MLREHEWKEYTSQGLGKNVGNAGISEQHDNYGHKFTAVVVTYRRPSQDQIHLQSVIDKEGSFGDLLLPGEQLEMEGC